MLYQLSYASTCVSCPPHSALAAICTRSPDTRSPEAGDGARTRDIKLGRLALYQLSYSRGTTMTNMTNTPILRILHGGGRIRTFEGVSRQIYSLLPLAAWVPHPDSPAASRILPRGRADGET